MFDSYLQVSSKEDGDWLHGAGRSDRSGGLLMPYRISAGSDRAKPGIGTALQPALVYMIGYRAPFALHKISDLSLVTYRSAAPPPQRMRLDLLCSSQI